ncbi:MAG: hypothetical protein ACLP8S_15230 [Solirubrobacteraceae bacterium]
MALSGVLAAALLLSPAAFASSQVVQSPQPLESGCPAAAGKPPVRGSHCVPVPVSMIQDESFGPGATCGQAVFMQVPLLKGIAEYGALWTNINKGATPWLFTATGGRHGSGSGPYGEEQYSTTALTPQNTGVNVNYKVPKGNGAWFVAAGGGPAPCDLRPGTAVAWAWTARYSVTGSVTIAGSGGVAVPNVRVLASCASGGATTTDSLGDYEFVLDRGPCTIAPQLPGGKKSSPQQRSLNVTHSFSNVDFQAPCNAIGGTAADVASAAAARSACKLDVSVKFAPSTPHAGLVDDTSQNKPSFWAAGTSLDSQQAGSCLSGCVDLLVTVTDDLTHLPVEGATVNAVVDPMRTVSGTSTIYAPYPTGIDPGFGFLCSPSPTGNSTTCGNATSATLKSGVTGQQTDVNGHVLLRYWAPGLASNNGPGGGAVVYLKVLAKKSCSSSSCPRRQMSGQYAGRFNVFPRELYAGSWDAPLWFTQAWAQLGSGQITISQIWQKITGYAKGPFAAGGEDADADWLLTQFTPAFNPSPPFLVGTTAIGGPSWSVTDPKNWFAFIPLPFTGAYQNFDDDLLGVPGPLDGTLVGYSGASMFAQLGRSLFNGNYQNTPMQLNLTVFEVSACDPGQLCGPGYTTTPSSIPGAPATLTTPGVHPFLYFNLTAKDPNGNIDYKGGFSIPYQAEQWWNYNHHWAGFG